MRKLTKTALVVALAIVAMFSCVMGLTFKGNTVKASADGAQTSVVDIESASFEMVGASVRLAFEDSKLDYEKNGIKFTASVSADFYASAGENVVYGMIIVPTQTINAEKPVSTATVFGAEEDRVYTFDKAETDKIFAVRVETGMENMIPATLDSESVYCLSWSMVNLAENNVARDFTAVPYLKAHDAEGNTVYSVKTESDFTANMANVAKTLIEGNSSDALKIALLKAYGTEAEDYATALAGNYTNTWILGEDKSISYKDLTTYTNESRILEGSMVAKDKNTYTDARYEYYGHAPIFEGDYVLYDNGMLVITLDNGKEILASYSEENGLVINGEKVEKVDMSALVTALAGASQKDYGNSVYKPYSNNGLRFKTNGTGLLNQYGWNYNYEIIPITENYGKIDTFVLENTYSGGRWYYYGSTITDIYYTLYNGEMILHVSNNPVTAKADYRVPYNHYIDFRTPYNGTYGNSFTLAAFDQLANKYMGSSEYVDGENTLVLYNDGVQELLFKYASGKESPFMGGVAKFNGADATYNLIKITDNAGKFLIDMSAEPSYRQTRADKTNFVKGDYVIEGDDITITFSYGGVDYSFELIVPVEVDASVYQAFAGKYTDTYAFTADGKVTKVDLNKYSNITKQYNGTVKEVENPPYYYRGHNVVDEGSYVLMTNGEIIMTLKGNTYHGSYDVETEKFTINGEENKKVDVDAIYAKTTGTYTNNNYYGAGADYKYGFQLQGYKADIGAYRGLITAWYSWAFTYELIPITENFGKVDTFIIDNSQTSGSGSGFHLYDYGHTIGEIYYTYDETNGIRFRIGDPVNSDRSMYTGFNHFNDLTKDGSEYSTVIFEKLAGTYVDETVSKTYVDGDNSLVLYNDGVLELPISSRTFMGGKAKFNGEDATYNVIGITDNSGKFFIDMSATPAKFTSVKTIPQGGYAEIPARFVQGDYVIDGEKITITFTYSGTNYTFVYNVA